MFLFNNLFLIAPIGLPPIGAGKKISGITNVLSILVHHLDYFLSFVALLLLIFLFTRIYKYIFKIKLKKIEILLYRLYSEILLLDKVKNSAKIGFSEKESIELLLKKINSWFFIKKVGKRNQERIVDALKFIKADKLDTQSSLMLVENWVKMSSWLISNL
ncbi:hypothetical protein GF385_04250 [Candidatus Dependentiae bacterium]|nr:hypothetical protein [Candidatus Dependentiae bacterium]